MSGRLTLNSKEVDRLVKVMDTNAADIINSCAQDILSEAQRRVPVKTGALRASGRVSRLAGAKYKTAKVSFGGTEEVNYAEFVEYGTAPHPIYPRFKKALYWEGAAHPVAMVNHPGTPAKPFLQPAAEVVGEKYNSGALWQELVK